MTNNSSNNKRIAKNTIFLYLRMLVTMAIGLYTSRVVLATLGVEDYGIYNVVGGVVVLFTFISNAMASSTQRYLSFELGKENGDVAKVFSACFNIHLVLAVIVLLLSETIGLWFLNAKMNFPEGRMTAVNWCYQLSVLACIAGIIRVPHNAVIIAYERMSFFAYMGILEVVLKLLIVYALLISDIDKLVLYSVLMLVVTLIPNALYWIYCSKKIEDIRFKKIEDKEFYKELLSFSGWAFFGSVANVGLQQGINIIINLFYGVALNAAVGVANQVNSHVTSFVGGFQQALNPQLTKSEAGGDKERQFSLICRSAKFSYMIMLFLAFPIMLNLDYILTIWLGSYPAHTVGICNAIIIGALIETFSGPLWVTIFATGKIKSYQIFISILLLLNIPLSYVGGRMGMQPETMYIIRNVIYVFALSTRLFFLKRLIDFNVMGFARYAILPMFVVSTILFSAFILPANMRIADGFVKFIFVSLAAVIVESILLWTIGMNKSERSYLSEMILKKIKK